MDNKKFVRPPYGKHFYHIDTDYVEIRTYDGNVETTRFVKEEDMPKSFKAMRDEQLEKLIMKLFEEVNRMGNASTGKIAGFDELERAILLYEKLYSL